MAPYMTPTRAMQSLSRDDAWSRLRSRSVGRLAVGAGGLPDIMPLNFIADDHGILLRTSDGAVVAALRLNEHVAFEVDDVSGPEVWSVVVRGPARILTAGDELDLARQAPMWTWPIRDADVFVRIDPLQVTGRTFER